ncbi:hypothetical protein BCR35DRAFT_6005 [Leucosporidium creatinivorum]|uniref:Proteophosphoglycan ppg4 n=1 Tax=Leucosporidium creatinivorum TaxID=106004 RepID=A0A1Y2G437_9BASI|nr:hypothetical protein BCR35DRAFT_6005 [Leucosporidium creatinivorum]
MLVRVPLPDVPPAAGNPFEYWLAVVQAVVYPPPLPGLKARIGVLFGLVGYVALAALTYLTLTIIDYRRREKSFWVYRLVKRPGGSYIVGNLALLEPVLTCLVTAILLAHLQDEFDTTFDGAAKDQTGVWRIAPWSVLFFQCWMVSFASLQAFVLSADQGAIRFFTPRIANTVFVVVGVAAAICLITFDALTAIRDLDMWAHFVDLSDELRTSAANWSGGAADSVLAERATTLWSQYFEDLRAAVDYTYFLLIVFSITPFLTLVVNLASFGLLFAVRRQIKQNRANLLSSGCGLPPSMEGDIEASCAPVSISLAPATSLPPTNTSSIKETDYYLTPPVTSTLPPRSHSPIPSLASEGGRQDRRAPSRADLRAMAVDKHGGALGERARSLAQLHRAEVDLLLTGLTVGALSLSFGVLSAWVAANLLNYSTWS